MKTRLFFLYFFYLLLISKVEAQIIDPNKCLLTDSMIEVRNSQIFGQQNESSLFTKHGGYFTPKGDHKFFVVYVGKDVICDPNNPDYNWWGWSNNHPTNPSLNCKTVPDYHSDLFYSSYSQFNLNATDRTISNYFYKMSNGQLRIIADTFPERINSTPTFFPDGTYRLLNTTDIVNQLRNKASNYSWFNWTDFDLHNNSPNFNSDNSGFSPDGLIDYTVMIYRQRGAGGLMGHSLWGTVTQPSAPTPIDISYEGVSLVFAYHNIELLRNTLIHEIAHGLYSCPHHGGEHKTVGNKFYTYTGWSMLDYVELNTSANAFERYHLGWIPLNPQHDISSFNQNGVYTLRDHLTYNDFIRIRIPNTNPIQYLYLENRQHNSHFDLNPWTHTEVGVPFPTPPKGIYAFIESETEGDLQFVYDLYSNTNGFKYFNLGIGNHDYQYVTKGIDTDNWDAFWTDHNRLEANPFSHHNNFVAIRADYPFFIHPPQGVNLSLNRIMYDPQHQSTFNECYWVDKVNGQYEYGMKGINAALNQVGKKVGITGNPAIVPHLKYNSTTQRLEDFHLNGISFEIVNYNTVTGDIQLQIKYNDVDIANDQRMTGQIQLSDIPGAANDLVIKAGKKLTIDHSGTPNRETRGALLPNGQYTYPDFVTPTYLQINSGTTLLIEDQAELIVNPKSTLIIKSGANVIVQGSGRIDVKDNAFICIEPGANLQLVDPPSRIFVRQAATIGSNPHVSLATPTTGCMNRCQIQALLATNGSDGIIDNTFLPFTAGADKQAYGDATGYTLGSATNPAGTYQWTPSQYFVNPNSGNPTISSLTHDQTFIVKYTTPSGCYSFDTVEVTIIDESVVQIASSGNQCVNGLSLSFSGVDMNLVSSFTWDLGSNASVQLWNSTDPTGVFFNAVGPQAITLEINFNNGVHWVISHTENIWNLSCCHAYNGTLTLNSGTVYEKFVGSGNGVDIVYGGGTINGSLFVDGTLTLAEGDYYINPGSILYFSGDWDNFLNVVKSKLVLRNAKLTIRNALLTSDCGQMWWGVEVANSSNLTMDGSTLEHSFNGIFIDHSNGSCAYQVFNNTFHNNLNASIQDALTAGTLPAGSLITSNQFNGNANTMIQPYNTGDYLPLSFLMFSGDFGDLQNLLIEQNVFSEGFTGICQFAGVRNTIGQNNFFSNCYKAAVVLNGAIDLRNSTFEIPSTPPSMPVYNHVAGSFIQTIPAPTGVYIKSLSMASSVIDGNNFNPTSVSSGVFPTQYGIYGDYAAF
jgi:hypothetical protein